MLGRSPVTIEHDGDTISVRARLRDEMSEPQTLRSFDGRVLGDFSAWARKLDASSAVAAELLSPPTRAVVPADAGAVEAPASSPTPARTASPSVGKRYPRSPSPAPALPTLPSPAPAPPGVELLDGRPRIAPIDGDPGIGLLDDAPRVAPID
jgi:hypothetical protein